MLLLLLFMLICRDDAFIIPFCTVRTKAASMLITHNRPFVCVGAAIFSSINPLDEATPNIRDEISGVVDAVVGYGRKHNSLNGFDPKMLVEHAHIITQGTEYEHVMQTKLEAARGASEVSELNSVDALLKGFIVSERKQRARLKMNYILAGAESGRLEEAIQLLSESEEIDEELLLYIDTLIKKELLRSAGPSLLLEDKESNLVDAERKLTGAPKETLSVLRMVQKLLQAELRTENSTQVRLLARLLSEPNPEERYSLLKNKLDRVELLDSFESFVEDGIAHLSLKQTTNNADADTDTNKHDSDGQGTSDVPENTPSLPAAVVEKMKDILYDVGRLKDKLKTGLRDSGTYSTVTEDYIDAN